MTMLLTRQKNGSAGGQRPADLDVGLQRVTPKLAAQWLESNPGNRNMRKSAVDVLARAMDRGEFNGLNGETLKFTLGGELVDGQHRLAAVVQSGVAQTFVVVRGVDFAAADTVDTGTARTFSDVLKRRGWSATNNAAAVSRWLWLYDQERSLLDRNVKPSHQELLRVAEANPIAEAIHKDAFGMFVGVTNAAFLRVVFGRENTDDATLFATRAGLGTGLETGDPILAFRSRVINMKSVDASARLHPAFTVAWGIKAFNSWRRGDSVKTVGWRATTEKFPRVEALST